MDHHSSLGYSYAGGSSPKYTSSHSTSSAFSASANPNEDWTKISDLAERRRIQNRIAQRNYRKKIKRRLEDLERRAGSSSASPEQQHAELPSPSQSQPRNEGVKRQKSKNGSAPTPRSRRTLPEPTYLPHPKIEDDEPGMYHPQYSRDLSTSPPPSFPFSYALASPPVNAPYSQHSSFQGLPAPAPDYSGQSLYLPPIPSVLPSMSPYELGPMKSENPFEDEGMLGNFNMGYPSLAGMDIADSYQDSNPHTPQLSHSHSFERGGSPALTFPGTPGSIPDSPLLTIR